MPDPARTRNLSSDHLQVLQLVAQGLTDRRIARELGVSESTVQRRIREAGIALGARSRARLAAVAVSMGLVAPPEPEVEGQAP